MTGAKVTRIARTATAAANADLRILLHRRQDVLTELRAIDGDLAQHGRRIADLRGCKPRLTIDQLEREFGE